MNSDEQIRREDALRWPRDYDGRDGSLEIDADEEARMIEEQDEIMRQNRGYVL